MAPNAGQSIWSQMNYVPPRGPCNHKPSIMSAACQCKRFMLHPLKALTSFECDGCGHHASFHNLENKQEDAILKRWEEEAKEKDIQVLPERAAKKRRRAIEGPKNGTTSNRPLQRTEVFEIQEEDVD